MDGEDEDEDRAEDEGGDADAGHREGRGEVVDLRVALHGGEDAGGETQDEGDEKGEAAELEGGWEFVGDDLVDGAAGVFGGAAEITIEDDGLEVVGVLLVKREVESVVGFEVGSDLGRGGFLAVERAAGDEPHHEERGCDDDEEDGDRLQKASGDEAEHGVRLRWEAENQKRQI